MKSDFVSCAARAEMKSDFVSGLCFARDFVSKNVSKTVRRVCKAARQSAHFIEEIENCELALGAETFELGAGVFAGGIGFCE